jgi:hypothetical protein
MVTNRKIIVEQLCIFLHVFWSKKLKMTNLICSKYWRQENVRVFVYCYTCIGNKSFFKRKLFFISTQLYVYGYLNPQKPKHQSSTNLEVEQLCIFLHVFWSKKLKMTNLICSKYWRQENVRVFLKTLCTVIVIKNVNLYSC